MTTSIASAINLTASGMGSAWASAGPAAQPQLTQAWTARRGYAWSRRGSATIPPKGAVRACGVRRIKKREYVFIFVNFRFADIHEYEYYTLLVFMTMNTAKSQYSYSYS